MKNEIEFRVGSINDIPKIQNLLMENSLPYMDLMESKVILIVAVCDQDIIGSIGIEKTGNDGLLRSFAVMDSYKNMGIGLNLYNFLLKLAKEEEIKTLHLLTTTADKYFEKLGFSVKDRSTAPIDIKNTSEFSELCPSSSIYMTIRI
jgi:amino-acid N-acetyltransferase